MNAPGGGIYSIKIKPLENLEDFERHFNGKGIVKP
jgi:hypothetical protein